MRYSVSDLENQAQYLTAIVDRITDIERALARLNLTGGAINWSDGFPTYDPRYVNEGDQTTLTTAAVTPSAGYFLLNQGDTIGKVQQGTTAFATGVLMIRNDTGGTITPPPSVHIATVPAGFAPLSTVFVVGNVHNPQSSVMVTVFANGEMNVAGIHDAAGWNDTGILSIPMTWQISD